VLDVGTARGYAAVWFGLAARTTGGRVVTIEIDPQVAAEARENIRRAGLVTLSGGLSITTRK
jgi:predicted O-methyltransferase YrrM